jgi:hypothetical protein
MVKWEKINNLAGADDDGARREGTAQALAERFGPREFGGFGNGMDKTDALGVTPADRDANSSAPASCSMAQRLNVELIGDDPPRLELGKRGG